MTDTDRLAAIGARLEALPPVDLRQRAGDGGVIEDADGQPWLVFGTSGDVNLPLGEFFAHAPRDARWLVQELTHVCGQLDELRRRIEDAGSLMSTS